MAEDKLSKISALCKRRGFIFPSCEAYGGVGSIWDYGPLGVQLKKNIKDLWWKTYVEKRNDIVGLDASIIMQEEVFRASGHLDGFNDVLVDCRSCKRRFRSDHLEKLSEGVFKCPECGSQIDIEESPPRSFNLMLKTFLGVIEGRTKTAYLRPETAQGIFTNFLNIVNSVRKRVPFGVAQIGKAFRNEVTSKSFIFRTKEFEQMEIEFFVYPDNAPDFHKYWIEERYGWYIRELGLSRDNLRKRPHGSSELAHYAKACTDLEYNFPFGWSELEGVANRGDFDLSSHARVSGKDFSYLDDRTKERFIPFVIEPSAGVDRSMLAVLSDAYCEETVNGRLRVILKLDTKIAPYKAAVFPLLRNNTEIVETAKKIYGRLIGVIPVVYDDTANIGKLYRRQDEIGTPFCVTVDPESLSYQKATLRSRDTMLQERVSLDKILDYIKDKL